MLNTSNVIELMKKVLKVYLKKVFSLKLRSVLQTLEKGLPVWNVICFKSTAYFNSNNQQLHKNQYFYNPLPPSAPSFNHHYAAFHLKDVD